MWPAPPECSRPACCATTLWRRRGGFVAVSYRDGAISDIWTAVRRCAEHTVTEYRPMCEFGWHGGDRPATEAACQACRQVRSSPATSSAPSAALLKRDPDQ